MGLSKPIIIASESVDVSNLATKSDLDTLANTVSNSVGAVKSVQRGVATLSNGIDYKDITISSVNTSKAVVFVESATTDSNYTRTVDISTAGVLRSATTLRLSFFYDGSADRYMAWQVVEFK